MKNKIFNICNFYALLWFFLRAKDLLYDSDIISVIIYLVIVAISLYYAASYFVKKDNPPFVRIYNVLFVVFCIYGVLNYFNGDIVAYVKIPKDFYLQNVVKSMLPFYAFYAFAQRGLITKKWLCVFLVIFLIESIGLYYVTENNIIFQYSLDRDVGEVTNNIGYTFLSIIPLCLFLDKKKVFQYIILAIVSVYIVLSMKRGAIITGAVCILYFFVGTMKGKFGFKQFRILILSVAFVVMGYYFIMELMDSNTYFVERVDNTKEGYSSGRDMLFEYYWNMFWEDSNPIQMLVGRGADGTIRSGRNYAHNDWLEILINQGFLGVILFMLFWYRLGRVWITCPKSIVKTAIGMCFITLFLKTFFSMSINDMTIFSTLILGIGIASNQDERIYNELTT